MTINTALEARIDAQHSLLRDVVLFHPRFTIKQYVQANIDLIKADVRLSKKERHKLIESWVEYQESFDAED